MENQNEKIQKIIDHIPEIEYQHVIIESSGIFVPQDVRCDLWKKCIHNQISFENLCDNIGNNWERLLQLGFNANFLTRNRWLDINVLTKNLGVSLKKIISDLNVTSIQIESWKLTPEEERIFDF